MCPWDYEMRVPWSQTNHNGAPWGPDNINTYHLYHLSICLSYICLHTDRGFIISLFPFLFQFLTNLHISTTQSIAKPLLVLLSFRSFQVVNVVKINVNFLGRHLRNPGYLPGVFKQKVFLRSRFKVFLVEKIKVFLVERIFVQCREELGTRIFCRPRRPSRRKSAALPAF